MIAFNFGQIITGAILVAFGAIVATEVSRNNSLTPANTPIPTQSVIAATPIATSTPVTGVSPISAPTRNTANSDPVIDCNFPHSGNLRVTQSKCNIMTDCEIATGKWQAVLKTDCDALHKNQAEQSGTTSNNSSLNSNQQTEIYFSKLRLASYTCSVDSVGAIKSAETAYFAELDTRSACYTKVSSDKNQCLDNCRNSWNNGTKTCQSGSPLDNSCLDRNWDNYQQCQKGCESVIYSHDTCDNFSEGFLGIYSKQVNDLIKKNCK